MNGSDERFAARQIPGQRAYQEDDYGYDHECALLLVADGMGGHVGGATASSLLSKTFVEAYPQACGPIVDRLRDCLDAANKAIADAIAENPALDSMGSTLVAAVVSSEGLHWISVGDSPLWLFRKGTLKRLNADHSMAPFLADMVETGRMTAEEAAQDPSRHSLREAVMGDDIQLIDESPQPVAVERGDRLVLASDGLLTLSEQEIAAILAKTQDAPLADSADALIQAVEAAAHPQQDNTTVLLYAPAEDAGLAAAADVGERERPRLRRWAGLLGVLLGIVVLLGLGVLYWPGAAVETPVAVQERTPAAEADSRVGVEEVELDEPQEETSYE